MPIYKIIATRSFEEECTFFAHLPSKDYLGENDVDAMDAQDHADSWGAWDEVDGDSLIRVSLPTEDELAEIDEEDLPYFGMTKEDIPERVPEDPRQTKMF